MGLQTRKLPGVFLREFQLGSRGLGVGILLKLLRSIAPLGRIQRSLSSYSLLLWKTKMRKDTNLQKKVYYNINYQAAEQDKERSDTKLSALTNRKLNCSWPVMSDRAGERSQSLGNLVDY